MLYPALVVFSIVATANHFFLDAIAGAGVLAVALTIVLDAASPPGLVDRAARARRPLTGANRPLVDRARRRPSGGLPPSGR